MTTKNPRVHVTLPPALDSLVTRLAAAARTSKADVLRELLEAAAPSLARTVALMEAAAQAKPEMLRGMVMAMEKAQARIEGMVDGTTMAFESQLDLVDQAEAVKPRRPRRTGVSQAVAVSAVSPGASRPRARSARGGPPSANRGGK